MTDISQPSPAPRQRARFDPVRMRGEADYRKARRRTRLVRWLRIVLPAAVIVSVGAYAAIRFLTGNADTLFSLSGLSLDNKSLTIERPRVSGYQGTERSYDIAATRAIQDLSNPKVVRLEDIAGTFGLASATVVAKKGTWDGNKQTLLLTEGLTIESKSGYRVTLDDALVNFIEQTLVSSNPIAVAGPAGDLHADTVSIRKGGKEMTFDGSVRVTYKPQPGDGVAAPTKEPAP